MPKYTINNHKHEYEGFDDPLGPTCKFCWLMKSTIEARESVQQSQENQAPEKPGPSKQESQECICLEDNKMTQALCPVHGVSEEKCSTGKPTQNDPNLPTQWEESIKLYND